MRRKKQKHTRRTLRFYRIQYGHRPPYKVLLDGNFVHALESMKKGESKELVERLLGDTVKCYTTLCVQRELKKLGKEFAGARQLLKRYPLHKCGHEDGTCSAAECLLAQLGQKNDDHFFVATQDKSMQRQCMAVPGGAVIFASVNGVHLEAPSALQQKQVKQSEQQHLLPSQAELQTVLKEGAETRQRETLFRRKKAKGPNPLSMMPKKKQDRQNPNSSGAQPQQQQQSAGDNVQAAAAAAAGNQAAAKRKRPRRRGKSSGDGPAGDE